MISSLGPIITAVLGFDMTFQQEMSEVGVQPIPCIISLLLNLVYNTVIDVVPCHDKRSKDLLKTINNKFGRAANHDYV